MSVVLYSTREAVTYNTRYGWAYLMLWVIKLKSLRWYMNFLWDVIGESSALHILHRRLHKTFAINCMFFLAIHLILFSYIQLILLWTKTSPNKQFKLSILLLPWVLSGILVVPNVFLNCSEQSGMIPMANCCKTDGNKTTIIIAYYDKIQENTSINAVL